MGQSSVAQFASELGLQAELLLEQLKAAGVSKANPDDRLTEQDKTALLDYLRKGHGAEAPKNKITLTRKQVTEIRKSDSSGKARTIQVEVRKKRVLVRRESELEPSVEVESQPLVVEEPVSEPAPVEVLPEPPVEVEDEAQVEPEVVEAEPVEEPSEAVAPVAEVASRPRIHDLLDADQIAKREAEARRHAELIAILAEVLRKKQARQQRRAEEAARKASEAAAAPAQPNLSEGTLHKPASKDNKPKTEEKPGKKSTKGGAGDWDSASKKRGIKTRGDVGVGQGWANRSRTRTISSMRSLHRPNRSCVKCSCPRPLLLPILHTRWR